jgi:hypothetical protein
MPEWNGRTEKAWRERTRMTTRHTLPSEMAAKTPMMDLYSVCSLPVTAKSVTHLTCPVAGTACPVQGLQALAPVEGWNELMGQRHCCDAPARQYAPAEQLPHDAEPEVAENVPAVQGVQTVEDIAPANREYVPAVHNCGAASPAVGQKLPAGHGLHVLLLEAPTKEDDVPLGHKLRTVAEALQLELMQSSCANEPAGAR